MTESTPAAAAEPAIPVEPDLDPALVDEDLADELADLDYVETIGPGAADDTASQDPEATQ